MVEAAWRTGSFTAAAADLGVGQATVSRRVAAVEEALGQVLFDRTRAGLVPSPAARALAPHLEALAAAARGAARAVEGLEVAPEGEVTIAAPPGLAVDWLPGVAADLARTHPGLRVTVLADILARDLDRREADLALRFLPTERGDLLVRRIADLPGGLFATPAFVAALPAEPTTRDLRLVGYAGEPADGPLARLIDGLGGTVVFRSNDYLVQRAAIRAGLGAGILGVAEARAAGLVPVQASGLPATPAVAPLYLVVHRALRQVPRVAAVVAAVEGWAQSLAQPAVSQVQASTQAAE